MEVSDFQAYHCQCAWAGCAASSQSLELNIMLCRIRANRIFIQFGLKIDMVEWTMIFEYHAVQHSFALEGGVQNYAGSKPCGIKLIIMVGPKPC